MHQKSTRTSRNQLCRYHDAQNLFEETHLRGPSPPYAREPSTRPYPSILPYAHSEGDQQPNPPCPADGAASSPVVRSPKKALLGGRLDAFIDALSPESDGNISAAIRSHLLCGIPRGFPRTRRSGRGSRLFKWHAERNGAAATMLRLPPMLGATSVYRMTFSNTSIRVADIVNPGDPFAPELAYTTAAMLSIRTNASSSFTAAVHTLRARPKNRSAFQFTP